MLSNTTAIIRGPCSPPPLFVSTTKHHCLSRRCCHHSLPMSNAGTCYEHPPPSNTDACCYYPMPPLLNAKFQQKLYHNVLIIGCRHGHSGKTCCVCCCHWPSLPPICTNPPTAFCCRLLPLLIVEYIFCPLWHFYSCLYRRLLALA
jgi:hypothetical protein